MCDPATQTCPHLAAVEALARDALADQAHKNEQRAAVLRHLEQCEPCRSAYRRLTADAFPRLRSYTVIERIGAGAFGEVFKVIHHAKQRTEALKLLYTETRFRTASFENEVHLIAGLRHPGIATLYDAHLGSPPYYYTMEFVEGRQLDDHFRSNDVPLADRIEIIRQAALAVDYAHRQGVVHRDLKPQNILIDTAGRPRIVDFGIARKLAQGTDHGHTAVGLPAQPDGSYGYIAPEEQAGAAVDGRADIYALGVSLCRSVTGEPPPADERLRNLTNALRESQVSRAPDLAAIIVRCLHRNPQQRYETCAKLAEDLSSYACGRPVSARAAPGPGYLASRGIGLVFRNHASALLVALALVIAVSLAGVFRFVGASWSTPIIGEGATTIIEFRPSTIEAIRDGRIGGNLPGLSPTFTKSWRLLHGRLMHLLAESDPRAVVSDFHVPDCFPQFDQVLIDGITALREKGIPVVIGCKYFDINGKPLGCRHVLDAVDSYGALQAGHPATRPGEFYVAIAIRRGLAPPIPGLAVAAFAAVRFPDSILDLRPEDGRVLACYRRRHVAAGEPEWRDEVDEFPIAREQNNDGSRLLHDDDEILLARIEETDDAAWDQRIIPFETVLTASPAQLKSDLQGRVVLIGLALPGRDEYTLTNGRKIFGCRIQGLALEAFLARAAIIQISYVSLLLRTLLYCGVAVMIARVIPIEMYGSTHRAAVPCAALCTAMLVACAYGVMQLRSPWVVELMIACCTILIAGCVALFVRAARERLRQISSGPLNPASSDRSAAL